MPFFADRSPGIAELSPAEEDYVHLLTYCVGILLLAFGAANLYLARRPALAAEFLLPYCSLKATLFLARSVLEFVYPVSLSLFWIEPFTVLAAPGVLAVLALYLAAIWLAKRN